MTLLRNVRNLRQAFREHPDLVPIMLRRRPLGVGAAQLNSTVALLDAENVPTRSITSTLTTLDLYTISSALHESGDQQEGPDADCNPGLVPHLPRAYDGAR